MSGLASARDAARRVVAPGLSFARRRWGRRVVNWTPEFMGFGNQLYVWAWAHAHRTQVPAPRVLVIDKMRYWIPHFPAVQPWLVEPDEISVLDRREHFWAEPLAHSGDPRGFTDESRAAFIRDWLLTSPALASVTESDLAAGDVLTLRNHTSASAVTLQPLAGGVQASVNASIIVEKVGPAA